MLMPSKNQSTISQEKTRITSGGIANSFYDFFQHLNLFDALQGEHTITPKQDGGNFVNTLQQAHLSVLMGTIILGYI